MLDVIHNIFRNRDYYIVLYSNKIYVYNYVDILNFSDNSVTIKLSIVNIKIRGSNLLIKKMENKELIIEGVIYGVSYE